MLITEVSLRASYHKNPLRVLSVSENAIITPAAWQFINDRGIKVVSNSGLEWKNPALGGKTRNLALQINGPKPEELTDLGNGCLVPKTHPRIALRGQLDLLQCQIIHAQMEFAQADETQLVKDLEEIAGWARRIMSAEVKGENFEFGKLLGLSAGEIRERSHHPGKYYSVSHMLPDYRHGTVVSRLNLLRSQTRVCELAAAQCFVNPSGEAERKDILCALNRLSSLFYILACRQLAKNQLEKTPNGPELGFAPVGISNRHVHLDRKAFNQLFGSEHSLQTLKPLSQPGQFAAKETVTLTGPKGSIANVRVLGPLRGQTQVEVSVSDTYALGIDPVVRDSGDLQGTPGIKISGPQGSVSLTQGAIVPARHLHLSPEEAESWHLKTGDLVQAKIKGQTLVTFGDVLVRVHPDYRKELHLTTDEGNSPVIGQKAEAMIERIAL